MCACSAVSEQPAGDIAQECLDPARPLHANFGLHVALEVSEVFGERVVVVEPAGEEVTVPASIDPLLRGHRAHERRRDACRCLPAEEQEIEERLTQRLQRITSSSGKRKDLL